MREFEFDVDVAKDSIWMRTWMWRLKVEPELEKGTWKTMQVCLSKKLELELDQGPSLLQHFLQLSISEIYCPMQIL